MDTIRIKGARQHNLKNINLELPKYKLIVFTGLSGSGKSSLAFDTIYAEGQRRYVESLSSYARQFLGIMDKPDVDLIEGLSPSISIDQKSASHNPRSTVGTVTEIYDYMRLLYARIGHPHCPNCGREISKLSPQQIVDMIIDEARLQLENHGKKQVRYMFLSPIVRDKKGEFVHLFDNLRAKGYRQVRVDGYFFGIDEDVALIKTNKHSIDAVIDRCTIDRSMVKKSTQPGKSDPYGLLRARIADAVDQALALSDGLVTVGEVHDSGFSFPEKPKNVISHIYSEKFACPVCNISIPEIEPRSFSFNSPHGACPECSGIGTILTVDPALVISPELSITEGGILPFAKMFYHDTWYSRVIQTVASEHGMNPRAPLKNLTKKQSDVLLYGTGDRVYHVTGTNRFGDMTTIEESYRGVLPELRKRFLETESEFVRSEIEKYMRREVCPLCKGKRLKKESLTITVDEFSISDVTQLSITDTLSWIEGLRDQAKKLSSQETIIATSIIKEIVARLTFLIRVGLDYLTLARSAVTLAGGEAQRIRLASQIGSGLSGVLYVLDEPSIGLHPRDNSKLIDTLKALRDLGNTVIVVEHDREMMEESDYLVDFGPGAGERGGEVVAQGTISQIKKNPQSLTATYLNDERKIHRPTQIVPMDVNKENVIVLRGASENNLKSIDVTFPLGKFVCVTGVSGSGKSTLIVETLYKALASHFNPMTKERAGKFEKIDHIERVDKVVLIDQSPIGRTPRSNPATYTGIFSHIRDIFAQLPESRQRGYRSGRFSFNVRGGRCEACEGEGQIKIEMQFLSDVYVTCEVCHGTRYNTETLEVTYHDKNIAQVLDMTVEEAVNFFETHPLLSEKLQVIRDVGLGYMHLGQPATTLSGGEAQRVKLATELHRRSTGKTVYILDEPTTGLHFADLEKLLAVLHKLTTLGNTVIIIEHNLDIIKNADWIIDLGPQGGDGGGAVVTSGTPRMVSQVQTSYTGQFLRNILQ
ncbi:excinuclease ABC subunit A [Candidatus Gottesmanbacteria bacterium RBG_13_45_10]|uniref:UvrABC system protein A n=1 Tax=Candidatus Gottesmanbacteria bacterium RBG_13_45_10 TaxID=1798370 RepID=A0A1F5ZHQ5_9BACT|nr:MAG: excinuclease ABC subunit A [Candidatus Gottesmanbacteria bacterium RBG_13_45_10]